VDGKRPSLFHLPREDSFWRQSHSHGDQDFGFGLVFGICCDLTEISGPPDTEKHCVSGSSVRGPKFPDGCMDRHATLDYHAWSYNLGSQHMNVEHRIVLSQPLRTNLDLDAVPAGSMHASVLQAFWCTGGSHKLNEIQMLNEKLNKAESAMKLNRIFSALFSPLCGIIQHWSACKADLASFGFVWPHSAF
jgi:hypothetical protein